MSSFAFGAMVLSLPHSLERRTSIAAALSALDIAFDFFDATDAADTSLELEKKLAEPKHVLGINGRKLTFGEIACADSHRRMYKNLIDSDKPGILIFEDDVVPGGDLPEVLCWINRHAETCRNLNLIFYLGGRDGYENGAIAFSRHTYTGPSMNHSWRRVLRSSNAIYRTCGYYISRAAALSMLESEPMISTVADAWELRLRNRVIDEFWVLSPPCVFHPVAPNDSSIESARAESLETRLRLIDRYPLLVPGSKVWRFARKHLFYPALSWINYLTFFRRPCPAWAHPAKGDEWRK